MNRLNSRIKAVAVATAYDLQKMGYCGDEIDAVAHRLEEAMRELIYPDMDSSVPELFKEGYAVGFEAAKELFKKE